MLFYHNVITFANERTLKITWKIWQISLLAVVSMVSIILPFNPRPDPIKSYIYLHTFIVYLRMYIFTYLFISWVLNYTVHSSVIQTYRVIQEESALLWDVIV